MVLDFLCVFRPVIFHVAEEVDPVGEVQPCLRDDDAQVEVGLPAFRNHDRDGLARNFHDLEVIFWFHNFLQHGTWFDFLGLFGLLRLIKLLKTELESGFIFKDQK